MLLVLVEQVVSAWTVSACETLHNVSDLLRLATLKHSVVLLMCSPVYFETLLNGCEMYLKLRLEYCLMPKRIVDSICSLRAVVVVSCHPCFTILFLPLSFALRPRLKRVRKPVPSASNSQIRTASFLHSNTTVQHYSESRKNTVLQMKNKTETESRKNRVLQMKNKTETESRTQTQHLHAIRAHWAGISSDTHTYPERAKTRWGQWHHYKHRAISFHSCRTW